MSTIIFSNLNFVHLPQYNNVIKIRYQKVDNTPKTLYFGKGGIAICILWFINRSKPLRENYPNRPKTHKLENLMLLAEDENKIRRNSGVSNVYTFSHANLEGVEFYAARRYVNLTKDGRE